MNAIEAHRKQVGQRVKKARLGAGLSLDRLAAGVGTSRRHLVRIEKGVHLPRENMLAAIARETGKNESFFELGDDDEEESEPVSLDDFLRDRVRQIIREETAVIT